MGHASSRARVSQKFRRRARLISGEFNDWPSFLANVVSPSMEFRLNSANITQGLHLPDY
jgi:hypothetical protein